MLLPLVLIRTPPAKHLQLSMHDQSLGFDISLDDYLEFDPQDYKTTPYGKVRVCIAKQVGALPT
jgi:hypothetical protein